MPAPLTDFGRIVRQVLRGIRLLSYSVIGIVLFLLTFRLAEITATLATVHPALAVVFVVAVLAFLWLLVGRPLVAFFRMPVVMKPPKLPAPADRTPADLVRHVEFIEKYVAALPGNPEWTGSSTEVDAALAACRELRGAARQTSAADLARLGERIAAVEREHVDRLLAPLDRKAADAIRNEAFKIGVATAVSPFGTLDAFVVLWRNCNLIARIARIYYGRPGPGGTLRVVRDVSMATLAGAYLQDLGEVAGEMVGSLAGKTAGFFTGPLMEGCLNGVATLRVGYLAKGRCRAFEAWTQRTAVSAARAALTEAGRFSAGLVSDLVRTVGGGIMRIPGKVLGGIGERLASIFGFREGDPAGEAAAESATS